MMLNKNNAKKVVDDSIGEREETGGITERIIKGTEGDNEAGECVLTTTLSAKDKEEDSDNGDAMEKLGKLTSKKQIQVLTSMIPFFMLLNTLNEELDDDGKPCKALEAHCFPVDANPINGKQIYKLMNHAADHPLKPNSGNFLSMMEGDTVALQTHRANNKVNKQIPGIISPT